MVNFSADPRPVFSIDARDRLIFANDAWVDLTRSRGGPEYDALSLQDAIGRQIWEFTPGGPIRQLWEVLYGRVRAVGAPVFVPMRADLPGRRRLVDLELHPLGDGAIRHIGECVWTEARPAVALLDPACPRDERQLRCCGWCMRIQVQAGRWLEIEDAQVSLQIEAGTTLPSLVAAVCSTCKQSLLKTFPARVARAS